MTNKPFSKTKPVVLIGSGMAGLLSAKIIAKKQPVVLLTKKGICDSNTQHSQGGIAAVWSDLDSSDLHIRDTLEAGRGLCNRDAVTFLSKNSKESIGRLIELGVFFDKDASGQYKLGLEGAHSLPRILYAGGDATGAEIQRALAESVTNHSNISVCEESHVTEIVNEEGFIEGVVYFDKNGNRVFLECDQVILASGGAGQIYQYTSNPSTATGEGNILAYSAGAELTDLEFFQFHPTGLCIENVPNFLISEAVRGEGAILRNSSGKAIMEGIHPLKDLAPRDIVARTIAREMGKPDNEQVYLDATAINPDKLERRFPTIYQSCLSYKIDIRKDPIPITPVAHYMIGGVISDLGGRTTVKGLYAVGETARTGVHGANRLASNSLLECAVFSIQAAESIQRDQNQIPEIWDKENKSILPGSDTRVVAPTYLEKDELRKNMWKLAGLVRCKESLMQMIDKLSDVPWSFDEPFSTDKFELYALKNLGRLIAISALQREESRGSHFRTDFPKSRDNFLYSIKRVFYRDRHFFT
ncbi:MAG: L-aspartate oxidase [Proteobacteria bacterium]|nr:L-aspartate oxidase [Pseudomonadota bacterium]